MRRTLIAFAWILVALAGYGSSAYSQTPSSEMDRRWGVARSMITHEDSLISGRLSSFLTLQGFLFAALGVVVKVYVDQESKRLPGLVRVFSLIISLVGAWSSCITYFGVQAAYEQNGKTIAWWNAFLKNEYGAAKLKSMEENSFVNAYLPRIVGDYKNMNVPENLPLGLLVAWVVLAALMIGMYLRKPSSGTRQN